MLQHYIQNQLYLLNPILPARLSTEMTLAYLEPVISHTTFITFREISLSYTPVKPTFSVIPFLISARGNFPSSEPLQYLLYISFLMFFSISAFIRTIIYYSLSHLILGFLKIKTTSCLCFSQGFPWYLPYTQMIFSKCCSMHRTTIVQPNLVSQESIQKVTIIS